MGLRIATNIASESVQTNLKQVSKKTNKELERLSSGKRITQASDDAAGLAIAKNLEAQTRSLRQAARNASDGISMVQTAEGGLSELHNILVRMRELSVQASNETYNTTDRSMITTEMTQLKNEYARITTTANFNRTNVLDSTDTSFSIQVGIQNNGDNRIAINMSSLNATLGNVGLATLVTNLASAGNLTTAQTNITAIDTALSGIATRRARLGALQNRMENALSEAANYSQNLSSSQSQIMDVDYASESANMTRYQIQQQAGVAALAQAKAIPQSVISLLS